MTLLECVNRILRINAIIRGDTDPVSTFNDTAHNASLNIAIIAAQTELIRLISKRLIPKERKTTGTILLDGSVRVYDLASDFIRFYGLAHFYLAADNRQIYQYPGGLEKLQIEIYNYATQLGDPNWWYFEPVNTTNKQIGFFLVPDSSSDGKVLTYDYEASVLVTLESDVLPFHNSEEAYSFTDMVARRFKYMFEDVKNAQDIQGVLDADRGYLSATSMLYSLLRGTDNNVSYGAHYV